MTIHKDLLFEILESWSNEQLDTYIQRQEEKLEDTRRLLRELKDIRRKRNKKGPLENGPRSGV